MRPRGKAGRGTTGAMPARAHYVVLRRTSRQRRWALAWVAGGVVAAVLGARTGWWVGRAAGRAVVAGLLIWDRQSGVLGAWPGDEGCHRLAAGAARLERHGWAVLEVGGRPAARRTTEARAAAAAADEVLSDALSQEIPVHPILAVHGLTVDRPHVTVGVTILPIALLPRVVLDSRVVLSTADVDVVAATARRLLTSGPTP